MRVKWKRVLLRGSGLVNCREQMNNMRAQGVFTPFWSRVREFWGQNQKNHLAWKLRVIRLVVQMRNCGDDKTYLGLISIMRNFIVE